MSAERSRKRAKRLLRDLRAGDEEATARYRAVWRDTADPGLQRAQHVIAVEAGFLNWAGLLGSVTP